MKKAMRIKVSKPNGDYHMWTVWREPSAYWIRGYPQKSINCSMWMLRDHNGYERGLESNWINSAARIREIAECYGYVCNMETIKTAPKLTSVNIKQESALSPGNEGKI